MTRPPKTPALHGLGAGVRTGQDVRQSFYAQREPNKLRQTALVLENGDLVGATFQEFNGGAGCDRRLGQAPISPDKGPSGRVLLTPS